MQGRARTSTASGLRLSERLITAAIVAALAMTPAASVHAAAWSDRLEPLPWIALGAVLLAAALERTRISTVAGLALGPLCGFLVVSLLYAGFIPADSSLTRLRIFSGRVADWLSAAFSGAAGTDNLLFAYTMGLLAWVIGYVGGWGAIRAVNPWWAIIPSGAALLLNLSYASPELLPLIFLHLVLSFGLLVHLNGTGRLVQWRAHGIEHTLHQGTFFTLTAVGIGAAIVFGAWRLPVGEVHRGVAAAWEGVAGPWQSFQTTFDRVFASLSPSTVSGRGLTVAQTMAPRGAFELGDKPVMRVAGREPAYWRAVTYDQYTGRVMTSSSSTSQRLDRRQPIGGTLEPEEGRKFVEYTITLLAPSSSVLYAPDSPLTVSVPSVYDYRGDRRDYSTLRPALPIREQQRYSVLAAVSNASAAELRQAGSGYPPWSRSYLQLPAGLPDAVRQQSWRVVGAATNTYDAAASVEQYLRGLSYSTRVPVPPADRDWVSFLLFDSKEGYCDYFATAMAVMLRTVGIPSRVASGYVTGDWDPLTQGYLVTERHAHSWPEVYFPKYGWIAFEPSANRPMPARLDRPFGPLSDEDILRLSEADFGMDDYFDDEELLDSGGVVAFANGQAGSLFPPLIAVSGALVALVALVAAGGLGFWVSGTGRVPVFARPYAQIVRMSTLGGLGPRRFHTPYEYVADLQRVVPAAAAPLDVVATAYVAGRYGGRAPEGDAAAQLVSAGAQVRRTLVTTLALRRWQQWVSRRLGALVQPERGRRP